MRQKTYLTPERQLDKTLALAFDEFSRDEVRYGGIFAKLSMGVIIRPMRFFRVGDFVVIHLDNGQGERWKCTAVTSKGYRMVEFYVQFFTEYPNYRQYSRRGRRKDYMPGPRKELSRDAAICKRSDQPIRFKEIFEAWSIDPTVQRINVDLLRAGAVESR